MVYIGKREYKLGRMIMSHMAADTLEELHLMASRLGIESKHFQDKEGKPHYDLCKSRKEIAIVRYGCKLVDDREIIMLYRAQDEKIKKLNKAHVMRIACLHLVTFVDEDNFIKCQNCNEIVDA